MNEIINTLHGFSAAEEFFDYLGVQYDQSVVNVNRLHILKRFNQYIARNQFSGVSDDDLKLEYRALLDKAYHDFVKSDAATEKVFKVFQDATGTKTFSLDSLRSTLPTGSGAARQREL
jgi:nitrogenase-stabilizing/protective protein